MIFINDSNNNIYNNITFSSTDYIDPSWFYYGSPYFITFRTLFCYIDASILINHSPRKSQSLY